MQSTNSIDIKNIFNLKNFKYVFSAFIIFSFAFIVLIFPEITGQGISDGIDICLGTLIPSLYPFLIISSLILKFSIRLTQNKFVSNISKFMFKLPSDSIYAALLSATGGYPVGGKIIESLYDSKRITSSQASQLMSFCVNPAPSFTISSVGFYMLGSNAAGLIIYFSVIISSLITGIISSFFAESNTESTSVKQIPIPSSDIFEELIESVKSASKAMLSICNWVVIFSAINKLIEISTLSETAKFVLTCTLEVTNGCLIAAGNVPLPVIAGIISFGGFCTHFQLMSTIKKIGMPYKYFLAARIVTSALATVICNLIINLFPISYNVFSTGTLPKLAEHSTKIPVSVCMIIMCILFVFGDALNIKTKRNRYG